MNIDSLMKKLKDATDKHASRTKQFGGFVAQLQECMERLGEFGIVVGEASQDRLKFSFLGTEYQIRLCKAYRASKSKLVLERLAPFANGEWKAYTVRSFFFDSIGNIFETAEDTSAVLGLHDINNVFFFLLQLLASATDELHED